MKLKILSAAALAALLYALTVLIPLQFYKPDEPPPFLENISIPEATTDFTLYDQATGETFSLPPERLLPNAIACEMDPNSPPEALKAQAVACYSWFCYQKEHRKEIVCDSEAFLVWTTDEKLQELWGDSFPAHYAALQACAEAVAGELLTVDGRPMEAEYFALSAGATLDGIASPWDQFADGYLSYVSPEAELEILSRKNGYVEKAIYDGQKMTGEELREKLGLRSAAFFAEDAGLTVRGWGHGRGMSQTGAQWMAKQGFSYREILEHYYPLAELS